MISRVVSLFGLSLLVMGLCLPLAQAEFQVPPLSASVVDQAQVLSPAFRQRMDVALRDLGKQTPTQMAILIVPELGGVPIESAAIQVVEKWKLGKKDTDRGLLLLVAMKERRMRIEVGQGLEGDIPDAIAKRIISDTITPRFKNGEIDVGIYWGVDDLISRAEPQFDLKNYFGGKERKISNKGKKSERGGIALIILFSIIILIFRGLGGGRSGGSGFYGGSGYGGGFGGGGFGGGSSGGFGGGGGGFSGGGASGGW